MDENSIQPFFGFSGLTKDECEVRTERDNRTNLSVTSVNGVYVPAIRIKMPK
jgi:hypothetical protein